MGCTCLEFDGKFSPSLEDPTPETLRPTLSPNGCEHNIGPEVQPSRHCTELDASLATPQRPPSETHTAIKANGEHDDDNYDLTELSIPTDNLNNDDLTATFSQQDERGPGRPWTDPPSIRHKNSTSRNAKRRGYNKWHKEVTVPNVSKSEPTPTPPTKLLAAWSGITSSIIRVWRTCHNVVDMTAIMCKHASRI